MQLTLANISIKLILILYFFQGIDITLLQGILVVIIILLYESLDVFICCLSDLDLSRFQVSLALSKEAV